VVEVRSPFNLMEKAKELRKRGLSIDEIAKELNVSRETAEYLIEKASGEDIEPPRDIYVDWEPVASSPTRLELLGKALSNLIMEEIERGKISYPEVVAGMISSGVPLASVIAKELGTKLTLIRPWHYGGGKGLVSEKFSEVSDKKVLVIDDVITTGRTAKYTFSLIREAGGHPIGIGVIVDKKGSDEIEGLPVFYLIRASAII